MSLNIPFSPDPFPLGLLCPASRLLDRACTQAGPTSSLTRRVAQHTFTHASAVTHERGHVSPQIVNRVNNVCVCVCVCVQKECEQYLLLLSLLPCKQCEQNAEQRVQTAGHQSTLITVEARTIKQTIVSRNHHLTINDNIFIKNILFTHWQILFFIFLETIVKRQSKLVTWILNVACYCKDWFTSLLTSVFVKQQPWFNNLMHLVWMTADLLVSLSKASGSHVLPKSPTGIPNHLPGKWPIIKRFLLVSLYYLMQNN